MGFEPEATQRCNEISRDKNLLKLSFAACPCRRHSANEKSPTASWADPVFSSQSLKTILQI